MDIITERVSADPESQHYRADAATIKVSLDGVELRGCVTADPSEGWADCYHDEAGQFVFGPDWSIALVRRFGRVTIWRDHPGSGPVPLKRQ